MAKTPISELLSTLKSYTQKLSDGERTPAEIASALNDWAHESAESLRAKIHDEVEAAVLKMGFVKREEFDALAREVASLKRKAPAKKATVKKSSAKKSSAKKPVKKPVKKVAKKRVTK
jgi:BMFP domain-containing protein YqiC